MEHLKGLSFEERLHVAPMSETEIDAALAEILPDGWDCIRCTDEMSVYYWNEETDQVTWLHPIDAAHARVANARASFQDTLEAVESGAWKPSPEIIEVYRKSTRVLLAEDTV